MKLVRLFPPSQFHAFVDYCTVVILFLAPTLFGFDSSLSVAIYVLAFVQLILTICTQFPYGIIKMIPFDLHGKLELAMVPILLVIGFYFFNQERQGGTYFFVLLALLYCLLFFATDFAAGTIKRSIEQQPVNHISSDLVTSF